MQFGKARPAAGAFFDSNFATIDSILAISLLYGLQGKNDCRVAVITSSRPDLATIGYVELVERFYHGPPSVFAQLPAVGMPTAGNRGETPKAFPAVFELKNTDGTAVYKNEVKSVIETGDPNTLIRNYLQAQYDDNAFFVLGGPATNLAAALDFRGMKSLIAAKIKYLVVAGGAFPDGPAEANIKADITAAKKLFAEWPTPIVASGYEIGAALPFPGASVDKEFAATNPHHPVADAYRAYQPMPYDTLSWDMAAALHAGRPKEGYFKLSEPGKITVQDDGRTTFAAAPMGKHQYLINDAAQREKILKAYVELASAKPPARRRFQPVVDADAQKKADDPAEKKP